MFIIYFIGVFNKHLDQTNCRNKAGKLKKVKSHITNFISDLHKKYRRCPQHFAVQRTPEQEINLEFGIDEE